MLQKLDDNTEKYGPVDDKINILIDIYHGGVDLLQGVERSFTDFCFRQSCTQSRKKRAEKGTLKLVNFPLTQAGDYVVIFIACVNV